MPEEERSTATPASEPAASSKPTSDKRIDYLVLTVSVLPLVAAIVLYVCLPQVSGTILGVLLAVTVACLCYLVLGQTEAAQLLTPTVKIGGSVAAVVGTAIIFSGLLSKERNNNFVEHINRLNVTPAWGQWHAVDAHGEPVAVKFSLPQVDEKGRPKTEEKTVSWEEEQIRFELEGRADGRGFDVIGLGADRPIGMIPSDRIDNEMGLIARLRPKNIWGPKPLYLSQQGNPLPQDRSTRWGSRVCSGQALPLLIEVTRFDISEDTPEGYTSFHTSPCNANGQQEVKESSLRSDQGELFEFNFDAGSGMATRRFIVAIISADHTKDPSWSSFLVIELG